ncbi:MAG: SMP-30/gluconolactonase/LRE family protein [Bacteroidota bacterium]
MTAFCQQNNDILFDSLKVVAPGAKLNKVSSQFTFTEGPATDKKGNIYFTDQPNDKIWKYGIDGKLSLFMEKTGRSNGLYFDHKGNLIACADNKDELWSISPEKKVTVLLNNFEEHRLNGPNDLWIDAKGGIYFTDPYYQRDYWDRKQPDIDGQKIYYLPAGKKKAVMMDDTFKQPNGIVGSPDGKYLFVADIGDNKTYRYKVNSDASLSDRKLLFSQGSDGMTLDNEGNIYVTGQGVTIYNKEGVKIGHIPVQAQWTANVAFGGKDRKILFITAMDAVYTLQMRVKGVE